MAEGTSASPEEEKAAQQDLIDEHMGDSKFVDFLTGAEKGSLDLTSLKDERILKFIEVYDQIESTSDQITEILQNRLFEGLNLNEVSNDAKKQIKEFLLEKAKESLPSVGKYIKKIREYQETTVEIAKKEHEIAQFGDKAALNQVRTETALNLGQAQAEQAAFTAEQLHNNSNIWNNLKRLGNVFTGKGYHSQTDFELESRIGESNLAARLPELTQKLAEIDGKLVNLTNAEVEKASLETTIQKLENGLLKDADMLKDVKECMLKAAKDRLEKSVGKLASQGSKYGGEDQIGLGEYAKLQADYSLWSGSKYFGEISTDPEAKALSDELINVLNTAITNEVKAVDPSNVGRSIDKTWQTIESALPKDEAKSKEALKLIRSTLTDRLNTETDRPKQLFLNRVLAKIKNNY